MGSGPVIQFGAEWLRLQKLDAKIDKYPPTRNESVKLERLCSSLGLPSIVREQAESYILQLGPRRRWIHFVTEGAVLLACRTTGTTRKAREIGAPATKCVRAMGLIASELGVEIPRPDPRKILTRGLARAGLPLVLFEPTWNLAQLIMKELPTSRTSEALFAGIIYGICQNDGVEVTQRRLGVAFQISERRVMKAWVEIVKGFLSDEGSQRQVREPNGLASTGIHSVAFIQ